VKTGKERCTPGLGGRKSLQGLASRLQMGSSGSAAFNLTLSEKEGIRVTHSRGARMPGGWKDRKT